MPKILGILNVTPDSFSDGGCFLDAPTAVRHARDLIAAGADAIDVGGASSHPDARPVSPAEELERIGPVVDRLLGEGLRVSVDSCQPAVQEWAVGQGVAFVNDIRGFPEPATYPLLARAPCDLIVMHSLRRETQATRELTEPEEVMHGMFEFFTNRVRALEAAGVAHDRIILDPGMGFFLGSNPETSVLALQQLGRLRATFGCRVLVSVSRKSFLGALTGRALHERGPATLAAELFAAAAGGDFIRTHDVRALGDALRVMDALGRRLAPVPAAP